MLDSSRCRRWEVLTLGVRSTAGGCCRSPGPSCPIPGRTGSSRRPPWRCWIGCWPAGRPIGRSIWWPIAASPARRWSGGWTTGGSGGGWATRCGCGRAPGCALADGRTARRWPTCWRRSGAGRWQTWRAHYPAPGPDQCAGDAGGRARAAGLAAPPAGPADQARRQARAARRPSAGAARARPRPASTDRVWVLLTTETTWPAAMSRYSGRFSTEGTYRDLKSWDWEAVVGRRPTAGGGRRASPGWRC